MPFGTTRRASLALAIYAVGARMARAAAVALTGRPILTVCGKISVFNSGKVTEFDRDRREALGMTGFPTTPPWYNEPVRFDGVPMERLMLAVGATGDSVTAVALDDYST